MTAFRTCYTCAKPGATCPARETLQAALAGLNITSVKHRCRDYVAAFLPGEAVKVETLAWLHRGEDDPPPRLSFPGHFVRLVGNKALVYVAPGAEDLNGEEVQFEPGGNGYLKVPLKRVAVRRGDAVDMADCRWCGSIPALDGHCGKDPHYTPSKDCLKDRLKPAPTSSVEPSSQIGEA